MFVRPIAVVAVVMGSLALALPAPAEEAATVTVGGLVAHELHVSAADLAGMAKLDVHVAYQTSHGPEEATFTGVPVWDILQTAGFAAALTSPRERLRHYLLVRAADGYEVAIALGEIEPNLEAKSVLIATARDGKPVEAKDGFRLVMPGDKHGARNVHEVTELLVK